MIRAGRFACIALVSVAVVRASVADAHTIQLTIGAKVTVTAQGLRAEIETRNSGDEPAFALKPTVTFETVESAGNVVGMLAASSTAKQSVDLAVVGLAGRRGVWPIIVRVAYTDANQHPFEAIHAVTLAIGVPMAATHDVSIRLRGVSLEKSAPLVAELDAPTPRPIQVTFFAPAGLDVTPRMSALRAETGLPSTVTATVTNIAATPGSRLPILAVAEYDENGRHDTVVGTAIVDIAAERNTFDLQRVLAILLVALIAAWLVMALPTILRKSRDNA